MVRMYPTHMHNAAMEIDLKIPLTPRIIWTIAIMIAWAIAILLCGVNCNRKNGCKTHFLTIPFLNIKVHIIVIEIVQLIADVNGP